MLQVEIPESRLTRIALRLIAAKQDIVAMGFPEIISKILYEKYGKLAPLIAKWFKEYYASGAHAERPDWWRFLSSFSNDVSLQSLTYLYESGTDPESFTKIAEHEGIYLEYDLFTQEQVNDYRHNLVNTIRENLFKKVFFSAYSLIQDITSGKVTDVAPYKRLRFLAAVIEYDKKRHFEQATPLKIYSNGFKWIDAGKKSQILSEMMRNCGSAGLMSMDEDRTILALFGPTNKPHVMVTYSPNEKRISGDQCGGSSPVKPEYHDYVLDLVELLGVRFDANKSKSPSLRTKYLLRNKAQSIQPLKVEDPSNYSQDILFKFISEGQEFYTNGEYVVSGFDVDRIQDLIDHGEIKLPYPDKAASRAVFWSRANRELLEEQGVRYTSMYDFVKE